MKKEEFDYYIFVDYSENLIGYIIIKKEELKNCLPWIHKLKHYHHLKFRDIYLKTIKTIFEKNDVPECFCKHRITELRHNVELCSEVFEFCKNHLEKRIFISIDDRQYKGFMNFININKDILNKKRFTIVKEGELRLHSIEYKLNLIIDSLLNLKRTRQNK